MRAFGQPAIRESLERAEVQDVQESGGLTENASSSAIDELLSLSGVFPT